MRVVLVTPDLRPSSGGPAVNVPRLARALASSGVDVELHTVGDVPASGSNPRFVGAVPARPRRLGRSPDLLQRLLASPAEIFHANCLWMLPLGYAAQAARARAVPLVISPRGMLAPWSMRRSRLRKMLANRVLHPGALESAAGWHATSEQEAENIRALDFRQPICMAPNGIEEPSEDPATIKAHYLAVAPELAGKRVLLFYSRFHSKKRILELLADFAVVARDLPEWHLLAVGIPEQYSVAELGDHADRLGVARRCTIMDGRRAPKPYAMAELFTLPTHDENFGRVVAEALAAGLPVLTTTGTPWGALNRVEAGRCVPIADIRCELAQLLSWPVERLRAAGERGRRWALETFDWSVSAARLKEFYEALIVSRRGEPRVSP